MPTAVSTQAKNRVPEPAHLTTCSKKERKGNRTSRKKYMNSEYQNEV